MIPKIIHISWKDKNILNNNSVLIAKGLKKLIELNSNWKLEISTDDEVDEYLKLTLDKSDYNQLAKKHIVEKLDVWRLLKLYNLGGLYIDIDRLCNISLDSILTDKIKCVLPTSGDYDFSHDFMLTAPQNPIHLYTLQLNLARRKEGWTSLYSLGAQTYMHGITYVLMGKIINTNPGKEVFEEIRKEIDKLSFIKTYKENPPYHTITYRHDGDKFDHEQLKREFYASQGLKHWTGEW